MMKLIDQIKVIELGKVIHSDLMEMSLESNVLDYPAETRERILLQIKFTSCLDLPVMGNQSSIDRAERVKLKFAEHVTYEIFGELYKEINELGHMIYVKYPNDSEMYNKLNQILDKVMA